MEWRTCGLNRIISTLNPFMMRSFSILLPLAIIFVILCSVAYSEKTTKDEVTAAIAAHDVVLFGKTYCPYCKRAKEALRSAGIEFHTVELDTMKNGAAWQDTLAELTGQRTVPNVFCRGQHIGGSDKTAAAIANGQFVECLAKN